MNLAVQVSKEYDIPESTVKNALQNLSDKVCYLVSVSGKIGAGKDTIAPIIIDILGQTDNSVHEFFAKPLKEEVNEVIDIIKSTSNVGDAIAKTIIDMSVTEQMAVDTVNFIYEDVRSNPEVNTYNRTLGIRSALQYWGTEVRRTQDPQYWVKKAIGSTLELLAAGKSVYVTDARFENEIDAIVKIGGVTVRLNMSDKEQERRILARDGVEVTNAARNHPSETALDSYKNFDISVFTDMMTVEETIDVIMKEIILYV